MLTCAPQLRLCWQRRDCNVRANCACNHTATYNASATLRLQRAFMSRWRFHHNARRVGDPALAMCAQIAMTVAPQHAMWRRWRTHGVRANCNDGCTATCVASATLPLQCAFMSCCIRCIWLSPAIHSPSHILQDTLPMAHGSEMITTA